MLANDDAAQPPHSQSGQNDDNYLLHDEYLSLLVGLSGRNVSYALLELVGGRQFPRITTGDRGERRPHLRRRRRRGRWRLG
jgi:hypothetical protein